MNLHIGPGAQLGTGWIGEGLKVVPVFRSVLFITSCWAGIDSRVLPADERPAAAAAAGRSLAVFISDQLSCTQFLFPFSGRRRSLSITLRRVFQSKGKSLFARSFVSLSSRPVPSRLFVLYANSDFDSAHILCYIATAGSILIIYWLQVGEIDREIHRRRRRPARGTDYSRQ